MPSNNSNLLRRLVKGFAAQGFGQLVNLGTQVFGVPIYLHYWGKVHYGEWLLLSTVLGYLSISDLSFGTTAQSEMIMRVARDDKQGALTVFQSVWLLVTVISLAFLLVSITAVSLMPIETWLHLTRMSHSTVVSVVSLLILQVVLAQQGGLLSAGFQCDGNFARGIIAGNYLRLGEFCVGIVVVARGGSFAVLALAVLLSRVIGYLALYFMLRRLSPWLSIGFRHARTAVLRPLVGPALSYNAFTLGSALSLQGVMTVVGLYLGPAAVTVFSTSRTLTRVVSQLLNSIGNPVSVELSTAFGAHNLPLARTIYRRASQVAFWGALTVACFLAILGGPIYRVWKHGKVAYDPGLFHLLLIVVVFTSVVSISYVVPMSINRHQGLALVYLSASGLSLLVATFLVRLCGLNGAALALLAEDAFMIVYVMRCSLWLVEDDVGSYARVVFTPPVNWLRAKIARDRLQAEPDQANETNGQNG